MLHRLEIRRLFGRERRVDDEVGHAENAVERRADFMRHHGQEARFGAVGGFRLVARLGERPLGQHAVGHVAADALHLAGGAGAHRDLAPGDPARACGRGDLLVVDARAVGERRGFSLLLDRKRKRGRQNVFARAAGERTEGVVGIGDGAGAAAAHDHVALGLEKALGALLRFADFPVAIRRLVETRFHVAQLRSSSGGCAK